MSQVNETTNPIRIHFVIPDVLIRWGYARKPRINQFNKILDNSTRAAVQTRFCQSIFAPQTQPSRPTQAAALADSALDAVSRCRIGVVAMVVVRAMMTIMAKSVPEITFSSRPM